MTLTDLNHSEKVDNGNRCKSKNSCSQQGCPDLRGSRQEKKTNCKLGGTLVHRKQTCHVDETKNYFQQRRRMMIVMVVTLINVMKKRSRMRTRTRMEKMTVMINGSWLSVITV